jgi:hypothetical protein
LPLALLPMVAFPLALVPVVAELSVEVPVVAEFCVPVLLTPLLPTVPVLPVVPCPLVVPAVPVLPAVPPDVCAAALPANKVAAAATLEMIFHKFIASSFVQHHGDRAERCRGTASRAPVRGGAHRAHQRVPSGGMLELRDLAGIGEAEREALAREVAPLETMEQLRSWGRIVNVIVQDEFTYDVVVQRGRRSLAFGST